MMAWFSLMCINIFLSVMVPTDSIIAKQCVDTVGWHDKINNSTCSDYVAHGWCMNKTLTAAMQINSIISLNFPDLNCCGCGKKASLNLSSTARWTQNATTVAGAPDGTSGSSLQLLYHPAGINVVDDNTLYISDRDNNRVVLVQPNSTTATAVIGQGSTTMYRFQGPTGIVVTRTSIYVMDTLNFRVQKCSRNLSNPVTVAGVFGVSGSSTNMTTLSRSYGLFIDNYANLFVGDYLNNRVMMYPWNSTSGTAGVMVAGTGTRGSNASQLNEPLGLFVTDNGVLYIADYNNHRIQKWVIGATSGVTVAGTGVAGTGLSQFQWPVTVVVDLNGYMYISDGGNNRVLRWAPGASAGACIVGCSGNAGIAANQLNALGSIAFDSNGSLYVSDRGNNRVQKFQILNGAASNTTTVPSTTTQSTLTTTSESVTPMTTTIITPTTLSTTNSSTIQLTIATTVPSTTTQSTLSTTSQSVTPTTTTIISPITLSATSSSTTQLKITTTTQTMSLISITYPMAILIMSLFSIMTIILHVQAVVRR